MAARQMKREAHLSPLAWLKFVSGEILSLRQHQLHRQLNRVLKREKIVGGSGSALPARSARLYE